MPFRGSTKIPQDLVDSLMRRYFVGGESVDSLLKDGTVNVSRPTVFNWAVITRARLGIVGRHRPIPAHIYDAAVKAVKDEYVWTATQVVAPMTFNHDAMGALEAENDLLRRKIVDLVLKHGI